MTDKQIQKAKDELNFKYYGDDVRTNDNLKRKWTKKDSILMEELSCRDMINSMLVYGSSTDEGSWAFDQYLADYYKGNVWKKPLLTKERVLELIAEQKKSFEKAVVSYNVYEDSEGCTYNSCDWGD